MRFCLDLATDSVGTTMSGPRHWRRELSLLLPVSSLLKPDLIREPATTHEPRSCSCRRAIPIAPPPISSISVSQPWPRNSSARFSTAVRLGAITSITRDSSVSLSPRLLSRMTSLEPSAVASVVAIGIAASKASVSFSGTKIVPGIGGLSLFSFVWVRLIRKSGPIRS